MGKRVVKNYPSPRLMKTIGATNQSDAEAIGELVANCFDARVPGEPVHIVVDCRECMIKVIDDGKGMPFQVLEHAVCIGEDMSRYLERSEGAKGHFGMGFKTSCATLGDYYEIVTRPIGEEVEYRVGFDISDYSKRPTNADAWDIEIEDREKDTAGILGSMEHGTAFVISRLHSSSLLLGAIMKYLSEAFKGHLVTGDAITIIDIEGESHECKPLEPTYLPGTKVDIDLTCGPNDVYRITGWVALDQQTHNDGNYGFNIYRNNQLVQRWDKSWFKAHLMTSRIVGEVNLDFLESTFYKQGLQESDVWKFITAKMAEYLKPVVTASRTLSRKGNINRPEVKRQVVETLHAAYGVGSSDEAMLEEYLNGSGADSADSTLEIGSEEASKDIVQVAKTDVHRVVEVESLELKDGKKIRISCQESGNFTAVPAPFDYTFSDSDDDDEVYELTAIVNTGHALWTAYKNTDMNLVCILATSDAIYRTLVERLGYEPRQAQNLRNEWIEKSIMVKADLK